MHIFMLSSLSLLISRRYFYSAGSGQLIRDLKSLVGLAEELKGKEAGTVRVRNRLSGGINICFKIV